MAKTRDELLAMASDALESWDLREGEYGTSKATFALACVALAKEMREAHSAGYGRGESVPDGRVDA